MIIRPVAEGIIRFLSRDPELRTHYHLIALSNYSRNHIDIDAWIAYHHHERDALAEMIDYKNWITDDQSIIQEFGGYLSRKGVFDAAYSEAERYLAKGHYGLYP